MIRSIFFLVLYFQECANTYSLFSLSVEHKASRTENLKIIQSLRFQQYCTLCYPFVSDGRPRVRYNGASGSGTCKRCALAATRALHVASCLRLFLCRLHQYHTSKSQIVPSYDILIFLRNYWYANSGQVGEVSFIKKQNYLLVPNKMDLANEMSNELFIKMRNNYSIKKRPSLSSPSPMKGAVT